MIKQDNYYETEKYNPSDFPFVAVAIGHNDAQNSVERKSGWELNQFLWITEGKGMFKTCGKTIYLSKGHGFFTRKYIPHSSIFWKKYNGYCISGHIDWRVLYCRG